LLWRGTETKKPVAVRTRCQAFDLLSTLQEERELCPQKPLAQEGEASNPPNKYWAKALENY